MNTLDTVLGMILVISFLFGLKKGFLKAFLSLLGIVVAVYAAMFFSGYVENFLSRQFSWSEDLLRLASFLLTFLVVLIAFSLLGRIMTQLVNFMMLGLMNKLLGGLFIMLKYAFLVSVVFMFVNASEYYSVLSEEDREASILYAPVASLAPAILPEIQKSVKEIDLDWNPLEDRKESEINNDTLHDPPKLDGFTTNIN
jgi:membrane protein required for colicin V production